MTGISSTDDAGEGPLRAAFADVLGRPAWDVEKGHGSFLTMEFGAPRLEVREPYATASESPAVRKLAARRLVVVRGEYHLWIYCCNWRVSKHGVEVAWSEASDSEIHAAAAELDGQKLVKVEVDSSAGTSSFHFDLGGRLDTWPYSGEEAEEAPSDFDQWLLYSKEDVRSYRADGSFEIEALKA